MNKQTTQFRLPKPFADKWLIALRSGEYRQTNGTLVNTTIEGSAYCCLGVAGVICNMTDSYMDQYGAFSDIPRPEEVDGYYTQEDYDDDELRYQTMRGAIPSELQTANTLTNKLIEMNDCDEKSFTEIADWVEANVELY